MLSKYHTPSFLKIITKILSSVYSFCFIFTHSFFPQLQFQKMKQQNTQNHSFYLYFNSDFGYFIYNFFIFLYCGRIYFFNFFFFFFQLQSILLTQQQALPQGPVTLQFHLEIVIDLSGALQSKICRYHIQTNTSDKFHR